MINEPNLPLDPGTDDDDPLDEKLIDTLIEDGLFDDGPLPEEVEIVDDVDVYEEDYDDGDDSFSDEVDDMDADDLEDEIDHFYGEDGTLIKPPADADDDLL
jgi:hypothetical protein